MSTERIGDQTPQSRTDRGRAPTERTTRDLLKTADIPWFGNRRTHRQQRFAVRTAMAETVTMGGGR
ncbi:hypothetical protein AB0B66_10080 [Catellatospora sp. NPDC049111]|uniref:hypothetical protein n=1 Tax=Catellatospora sp. NPDC049111 TaxID=3155271 RepID=UPI00340470AD